MKHLITAALLALTITAQAQVPICHPQIVATPQGLVTVVVCQ